VSARSEATPAGSDGATLAIIAFGPAMAPLFVSGTTGAILTLAFGLGLGPDLRSARHGAVGALPDDSPHGQLLTFNLAGIFGASLAPHIATWLANNYGLQYVGYYLSTAGCLSLAGLLAARETKDDDLSLHA
jgi:hypothetical protein